MKGGEAIKWISHKTITLSGAYLITKNPIYLMSAYLGSTFPDALEGYKGGGINFKNHRQLTHWFVPYLIIGIAAYVLKQTNILNIENAKQIYSSIFYFLYGIFLHLLLDALTGTIPSINPRNYRKRLGKKIIKTETKEYLIAFMILTLVIFIEKIN